VRGMDLQQTSGAQHAWYGCCIADVTKFCSLEFLVNFVAETVHINIIRGGPQKMAQSLWYHNFATIHHRGMQFLAKCLEKNSLRDESQCLNAAVKYSLLLLLTIELCKNSITLDTAVHKNVLLLLFLTAL